MMRWALVLVAVGAVTGCDDDAAEICGVSPQAAGDRSSYPSSGVGTSECSVLADQTFTNPDGSEYSLGADVFADKQKKLLLISTGAGWCTACIEEQPVLNEFHSKWSGKGLQIIVTLFEDFDSNPATPEFAAGWKAREENPFPVLADAANAFAPGYYDDRLAPMNMFVDVETMTILSIEVGFDREGAEAIIETWLQ